jgi:hypothetical protein
MSPAKEPNPNPTPHASTAPSDGADVAPTERNLESSGSAPPPLTFAEQTALRRKLQDKFH